MLALEAKNPLLSDIKSAIENIIFTGNQANGSVISTNIISITDKLRHEILKILISYSALHTTKKSSPPDFHRFRG